MFLFVDTYLVYKVVFTCLSFKFFFYDLNFLQGSLGQTDLGQSRVFSVGSASRKEDQHLRLKAMLIVFQFREDFYSRVSV